MGLIYNRRQFDAPPQSIAALWDARYRGKVLIYNSGSHNFSLAAQVLGKDSPFASTRTTGRRRSRASSSCAATF